MEFEELSNGEDAEAPRPNLLAWTAIAVLCVLAGVLFFLVRPPVAPAPEAGPAPSPSWPSGVSPDRPVLAAGGPETLQIAQLCPAVTDGRRGLNISFELQNIGPLDVTLLGVKAVLPIGGLRQQGPVTSGGTCEHPGSETPGGLIMPGGHALITMGFRLPKACPQPYPVQARVQLRVNQMIGTTTVPVLNDLDSIDFDTCPEPRP